MKYDREFFDAGLKRENTDSVKWDASDMMKKGDIPLWVADMDFACAKPITDALTERAQHPCFGYTENNAENTRALCDFWKRRHRVDFMPENTALLPCVVTGLRACVRALTKEGDGVAIFTPCYGPFAASIADNDRKVVGVPLVRDEETGRYSMDLEGMEKALADGARMIMLCNPHNPVSRRWSREELTKLVKLAKKYGVPLVSDEIHADFVYPGDEFVSILAIEEAHDCSVMLCAASKTFNVAGLQQAQAVSYSKELLEKVERVNDTAGVTSGNIFALCATRAAYEQGDEWLDGLMDYLNENRRQLPILIKKYLPKAKLTPIEATYLGWLDLRAYGKSSDELVSLFKRHGAVLNNGTFFGNEGEGFVRINFGCPLAQLGEGIRRMGEALKEA